MTGSYKTKAFWTAFAVIYVADFISKRIAAAELAPMYVPHRVIGDLVRFTLAYNQGAAMGLSLGGYSRVGFAITASVILVVIATIYRRTSADARWTGLSLGLIAAGAVGNLTDRLISSRGVVDFIDVGIGDARFYTFNIADSAVTVGAILLAVISMRSNPATDAATETGGLKKEA